jgi:hypothetical protein
MKKTIPYIRQITAGLVLLLLFIPGILTGMERFQIELFGGIFFINPKDFNLISKAEQQYNDIYFVERLRHYSGYFVNDFPKIREAIPAGLRLRYSVTEKLSLSISVQGFIQKKKLSLEGSFGYSSTASENHTKRYDPFRLGLSSFSILSGVHYRLPVGNKTDIEVGAAAGWAVADFDFSSHWSYAASYQDDSVFYDSMDEGVLEGDGTGNGFTVEGMLRLSRMLGSRIGFYVETAYSYCRMKSIEGGGRETRIGIPEETTWQGIWNIKKEEIQVPWGNKSVFVPTNYMEGWTASQIERDFVLDISGFRLVLGFCIRL